MLSSFNIFHTRTRDRISSIVQAASPSFLASSWLRCRVKRYESDSAGRYFIGMITFSSQSESLYDILPSPVTGWHCEERRRLLMRNGNSASEYNSLLIVSFVPVHATPSFPFISFPFPIIFPLSIIRFPRSYRHTSKFKGTKRCVFRKIFLLFIVVNPSTYLYSNYASKIEVSSIC